MEDLRLLLHLDIHEGEEARDCGARRVEELQVGGIDDDLEQRVAGGLLQFPGDGVDDDHLLALELRDDAFAAAVEDQAGGREVGDGDLLAVVSKDLLPGEAGVGCRAGAASGVECNRGRERRVDGSERKTPGQAASGGRSEDPRPDSPSGLSVC